LSGSMGAASEAIFKREDKYGAHNYHPLPVALCRGEGRLNICNDKLLSPWLLNWVVQFRSASLGCRRTRLLRLFKRLFSRQSGPLSSTYHQSVASTSWRTDVVSNSITLFACHITYGS
jgi:hypothetical protein